MRRGWKKFHPLSFRSGGTMHRLILAALTLAIFSDLVRAQEISPVVQELKGSVTKPAKGQFTIRNLSVLPLNVSLETRSLDLKKNGEIRLMPLDPRVTVKLSEYSFRLPARSEHIVYFESICDNCAFSIYSSMVVGRTAQGIQVAVHLPETIYSCTGTAKHCRAKIRHEQFGLAD
jgi:hypothetical protein